MNNKPLFLGTIAAFILSGAAFAQDSGYYVRADLGHSKARDAGFSNQPTPGTQFPQLAGTIENVDSSSVFGLGVGYQFSKNLRADMVYNQRNGYKLNGNDSGLPIFAFNADIKSDTAFLTGYYTFDMPTVKPYLGLGGGWARNKMGSLSFKTPDNTGSGPGGTKNNFAWQFVAGLDVPMTNTLTFNIAYHYVDVGQVKTNAGANVSNIQGFETYTADGIKGNLRTQELQVGLRYRF